MAGDGDVEEDTRSGREVRPFRGRWHVNSFLSANSNTDKGIAAAEPSIWVAMYRWGFHFESASYNLL